MSEAHGYPALPRIAGWSFLPLSWLARLPSAMLPIGSLTLVYTATDSATLAGIASGAVGAGTAVGAPLLGMAVDRWGQRRVLLPVGLLSALALLLTVSATVFNWAFSFTVTGCFLAGFTTPQIPVMVRARWLALIAEHPRGGTEWGTKTTSAALSYESMADELSYVAGPVLVGVIASLSSLGGPLTVAAILTAAGTAWFALHRTAPKPSPRPEPGAEVTAKPRLPLAAYVPVVGMLTLGAFFGSMLTVVSAFAKSHGDASQAGLLYGAMGITSAVFALAMVKVPDSVPYPLRWLVTAAFIGTAACLLPLVDRVSTLGIIMALIGIGIGPVMVTMFSLVSEVSPPQRYSLALTLMSAALVTGQAFAAPITGRIVDAAGVATAAWAPAVCAATLTLCGAAALRLSRSALRDK
ncbi:MFS transporter [Dermabacteraceae bacterium P13128]